MIKKETCERVLLYQDMEIKFRFSNQFQIFKYCSQPREQTTTIHIGTLVPNLKNGTYKKCVKKLHDVFL